jgi:hypothetical protein
MKLRVVGLCLPTFLSACGSSSKGPNVTLLLQKPPGTDDSCLGIVGFEVSAQPTGKSPQSDTILSAAAVQTVNDCVLARPFTMGNLDVDSPVSVTVRGYDGAHQARVSGTANIDNLHGGTTMIDLKIEGTPPPPLILDRATLLGGIPLSEVNSMTVSTAKGQPVDLKTVTRSGAPAFFDVDPGGFGIEGIQNNQDLTISFTFTNAARSLPKQRVVTHLDASAPIFRAP